MANLIKVRDKLIADVLNTWDWYCPTCKKHFEQKEAKKHCKLKGHDALMGEKIL
jgi:rRNA maturation endonuclease Nob1